MTKQEEATNLHSDAIFNKNNRAYTEKERERQSCERDDRYVAMRGTNRRCCRAVTND